jgi:hypothetical protein
VKVSLINPTSDLKDYLNPVLLDGERWAAVMVLTENRGRILVGSLRDLSIYQFGY